MVFRQIEIEMLGSFVINFVVGYTRLYNSFDSQVDSTQAALVYGMATSLFVMFAFPHTKCHFTPVLTLAEMLFSKISLREGMTLLFSQFIGVSVSTSIQYVCLNDKMRAYLSNSNVLGFEKIDPQFTTCNSFWVELVFSAIYVYVCFELSNPRTKGQYWVEFYGVTRGVVITIALLVGESMRYVVLNPMIVAVCGLFNQDFLMNQWPYYVGPLIGLLIGGVVHNRENIDRLMNDFRVSK